MHVSTTFNRCSGAHKSQLLGIHSPFPPSSIPPLPFDLTLLLLLPTSTQSTDFRLIITHAPTQKLNLIATFYLDTIDALLSNGTWQLVSTFSWLQMDISYQKEF